MYVQRSRESAHRLFTEEVTSLSPIQYLHYYNHLIKSEIVKGLQRNFSKLDWRRRKEEGSLPVHSKCPSQSQAYHLCWPELGLVLLLPSPSMRCLKRSHRPLSHPRLRGPRASQRLRHCLPILIGTPATRKDHSWRSATCLLLRSEFKPCLFWAFLLSEIDV